MTIIGTSGLRPEKGGALPLTVGGAVDAEEYRGAGKLSPVQQITHSDVGGHPADAFLAADVNRQLDGFVQIIGQHQRPDVVTQQPGTLKSEQAPLFDGKHRVEQRLDGSSGVHGYDHDGWVLGQRQRFIGSEVAPRPETTDAA